jgi:ADP-ribosylglycohydrolase
VLREAERSAAVTHNHPEGIKGAQATALAVFLARGGADAEQIRREISGRFGYDLSRTTAAIRPDYTFDVSCQGSVPEALICALEGEDWEHAVRLAISLGGDADTQACIAGAVAEALHGPAPAEVTERVFEILPEHLAEIVDDFCNQD